MGRLRRFEQHRYVGFRDDMVFYDCEDDLQSGRLQQRIEADDAMGRLAMQTFAPDTMAEARNRGFRPL